jgi:hypothetical protein
MGAAGMGGAAGSAAVAPSLGTAVVVRLVLVCGAELPADPRSLGFGEFLAKRLFLECLELLLASAMATGGLFSLLVSCCAALGPLAGPLPGLLAGPLPGLSLGRRASRWAAAWASATS